MLVAKVATRVGGHRPVLRLVIPEVCTTCVVVPKNSALCENFTGTKIGASMWAAWLCCSSLGRMEDGFWAETVLEVDWLSSECSKRNWFV